MEEEFVPVNQYSATSPTMPTTLGYQVLSIMGSRVRGVIASTFNPSPSSSSAPTTISSKSDRRWPRKPTEHNEDLPILSLDEVSYHDTPDDCWMVIYDRVYDMTDFLNQHPGGEEMLLEYGGRDATLPFRGVGHSNFAETTLKRYIVGILPESERIWTRYHNMNADAPEQFSI